MGERSTRRIERLALGLGAALLLTYVVAVVDGEIAQRRSLERFEEARAARALAEATADTKLWSQGRIDAYRASLERDVTTPLAILRIPGIELEVAVLDGTDELTLNRAVGRIEGTALPGEAGNVGIAGHRDGFFRGLEHVAVGDTIELETLDGSESYRIDAITIVDPEQVDVLEPSAEPTLTLVTCYPFYHVGSAPERYIVRALRTEPGHASDTLITTATAR